MQHLSSAVNSSGLLLAPQFGSRDVNREMLSRVCSLCRPGLQFQNSSSAPTSLVLFQCPWYLCVGSLIEQCACLCPCAHACVCVCMQVWWQSVAVWTPALLLTLQTCSLKQGVKDAHCKWTLASKLHATDCSTWLCKVYKLFVLSLKLEIWNIFEASCPFKTIARCDEGTWWWICRKLVKPTSSFPPLFDQVFAPFLYKFCQNKEWNILTGIKRDNDCSL